ncbi:hypothetical protein DFP74_1830 [Nocardiopsis sp. Huas11]|uniref:hypothetical protein n=1 Tax=Nocardiopsis sp. Huas11 TaxID=2183912 RepID=UPI000EB123E4|nr:hypothetical protein [Nocardiopsis sp. Huas11]RKS06206.1 hypothetical protein DFP74_1830 [Nocardiopsis sp. Huas11]
MVYVFVLVAVLYFARIMITVAMARKGVYRMKFSPGFSIMMHEAKESEGRGVLLANARNSVQMKNNVLDEVASLMPAGTQGEGKIIDDTGRELPDLSNGLAQFDHRISFTMSEVRAALSARTSPDTGSGAGDAPVAKVSITQCGIAGALVMLILVYLVI